METDKKLVFQNNIIIVLLVFNTFFIGSIWMVMQKCAGSGNGMICPFSSKTWSMDKGSMKSQ